MAELVPRIEREIPELLRRGNAEAVSPLDLFHVHFCVPDANEWNGAPYCLLYHAFERPPQLKAQWRSELGRIDHLELRHWLHILDAHSFDYRRFAQSNPRPRPRPPVLSEAELERFARIWGVWRAGRGKSVDYALLEAKLTLLSGSQQPGYYRAADRVFGKRVCVTRSEDSISRYRTLRRRNVPGHRCPFVLYFASRSDHPQADRVLRAAEAAGWRYVLPFESRKRFAFDARRHDQHEWYLSRLSACLNKGREHEAAIPQGLGVPSAPPLFSRLEDYLFIAWGSHYLFAIDEGG